MQLKNEEKSIQEGRKGSGKEGSPLVKENAAPDDGEDIGDREETASATGEIDEAGDEKMIEDDLDEDKTVEIPNPLQEEGIVDGDEIEEADKIIEFIGERDEERSLLGELENKGDGEENGKDDDAAKHQPLDDLQDSLMGIKRHVSTRIHAVSLPVMILGRKRFSPPPRPFGRWGDTSR